MRYFLIAGEASGDIHGAGLIKEIKKKDPEATFMFFGGDLMEQQGGTLKKHYRDMAFMGILPVLMNLRAIRKNFSLCKKELLLFNPDVLILIDYPGFNLRMAKFAKANGISTAYYISPKIWAWKTKRVWKIKKYIDRMYTIFPFETGFYQKYNYPVTYAGNPVYDYIREELKTKEDFHQFCYSNNLPDKPIVAILAGSRQHEIGSLLPVMEEVSRFFPDYQFIVAGAPTFNDDFYRSVMKTDMPVLHDQTFSLLKNSSAALVASGTATLETALLNIPQVVCYKMGMGWFLELFRKQILKTDFFSLVNLVAEKEVVKELFQSQVTAETIRDELKKLLSDELYRSVMLEEYSGIALKLKSDGAAAVAARCICESVKKSKSEK